MAGRIPHDSIIKCTNVGSPPLIFQPDRLKGIRGAVRGSSAAQDGPAPLFRMCWMRTSIVSCGAGDTSSADVFSQAEASAAFRNPGSVLDIL